MTTRLNPNETDLYVMDIDTLTVLFLAPRDWELDDYASRLVHDGKVYESAGSGQATVDKEIVPTLFLRAVAGARTDEEIPF